MESNTRLGRCACERAPPDARRYRWVKDSRSIIDLHVARGGAVDFFFFFFSYRVSSTSAQNSTLPRCPFILSQVSEVCKVFSYETSVQMCTAAGAEDVIIVQNISAALRAGSACCIGSRYKGFRRYYEYCFIHRRNQYVEPF